MTSMVISLQIAAVAALLNLWLAVRCGRVRIGRKIVHGDGGDPLLHRRMRAHANFSEYAPIFLILLALVEYSIGSLWWLYFIGVLFVLGRILHGFGMDRDAVNPLRFGGILLTMLTMLALVVLALLAAWGVVT